MADQHQEPMPELGNFSENRAAYEVAMLYLAGGEEKLGRDILMRLRSHIQKSGEGKSTKYLLGPVEAALPQNGAEVREAA